QVASSYSQDRSRHIRSASVKPVEIENPPLPNVSGRRHKRQSQVLDQEGLIRPCNVGLSQDTGHALGGRGNHHLILGDFLCVGRGDHIGVFQRRDYGHQVGIGGGDDLHVLRDAHVNRYGGSVGRGGVVGAAGQDETEGDHY